MALDTSDAFEISTVIDDAAEWELANDGAAAYVLQGYSRETPLGTLALVDFPSGETVQPIATVM